MRAEDLRDAERLSAEAFLGVDLARTTPGEPVPALRSPERAEVWVARTARFLERDAAGCWAAERDGHLLGFATSFRRETTWFLATYAVRPEDQGLGIGRALLDAALTHSQGCLHGMLSASSDPRAVRRYALAGFELHPQMTLSGRIDRGALPDVEHVRPGTAGDQEWMDSLDRGARGAAHGDDHEFLRSVHDLRVIDHSTGRGYVYTGHDGSVALLAASNRRTATRLLHHVLATVPGDETAVHHVTGANQWAVEAGVRAGLAVRTEGYLGLRGLRPPTAYIHHGSLL